MANTWNRDIRRVHRWGAFLFLIPLALVIVSGLLLQVKKQFTWVQPPTMKGANPKGQPEQNWERIFSVSQSIPEAEIETWADVERLDVRIDKGIVKILAKNRWEIQMDLQSGDVLHSAYRRSDLIESLHDGTFFGEWAKLGIFLPNGIALAILWITGVYLWYLPYRSRRRKKVRRATETERAH
jgi:uncharacterized iron-regulated membrane protein